MIKIKTKQVIEVSDWDKLVEQTYGRTYNFQQQDGCQSRGNHYITIPEPDHVEEYDNDTLPEGINGDDMGVSFAAWLARDPKEWKGGPAYERDMFWERNFYPDIQMVANDLHSKGLIPAGDYTIEIDW